MECAEDPGGRRAADAGSPAPRFSPGPDFLTAPSPSPAGIIAAKCPPRSPKPPCSNTEAELARRSVDAKGVARLELSATPARLRWAFDDLVAADGHRLSAVFTASVTAVDDPPERQLLAEVFLTPAQARVTGQMVTDHLAGPLHAAAASVASRSAGRGRPGRRRPALPGSTPSSRRPTPPPSAAAWNCSPRSTWR